MNDFLNETVAHLDTLQPYICRIEDRPEALSDAIRTDWLNLGQLRQGTIKSVRLLHAFVRVDQAARSPEMLEVIVQQFTAAAGQQPTLHMHRLHVRQNGRERRMSILLPALPTVREYLAFLRTVATGIAEVSGSQVARQFMYCMQHALVEDRSYSNARRQFVQEEAEAFALRAQQDEAQQAADRAREALQMAKMREELEAAHRRQQFLKEAAEDIKTWNKT